MTISVLQAHKLTSDKFRQFWTRRIQSPGPATSLASTPQELGGLQPLEAARSSPETGRFNHSRPVPIFSSRVRTRAGWFAGSYWARPSYVGVSAVQSGESSRVPA